MADVIGLILADHQRIRRLAAALRAAGARGSERGWVLPALWAQLASLIEAHTAAEEEICWRAMTGTGPADLMQLRELAADGEDIREAIAEAGLQPPGSAAWWRAVNDAVRGCAERSGHEESGILAGFTRHASQPLRTQLGRQWLDFTAAVRRDEQEAASQELAISARRDGPVWVLALSGDLDLGACTRGAAGQIMRALPDLAEPGAAAAERLVLDLGGLRFLDCAGARVLVALTENVPSGCPVIVRSISPLAARLLGLLGISLEQRPAAAEQARQHAAAHGRRAGASPGQAAAAARPAHGRQEPG